MAITLPDVINAVTRVSGDGRVDTNASDNRTTKPMHVNSRQAPCCAIWKWIKKSAKNAVQNHRNVKNFENCLGLFPGSHLPYWDCGKRFLVNYAVWLDKCNNWSWKNEKREETRKEHLLKEQYVPHTVVCGDHNN